jgi:glycine/D-amino acid oxidase-like deaminating enzyme
MYPDYVAVLEKETGDRVGFRTEGTIIVSPKGTVKDALREPELVWQPALYYPRDFSIDNRLLAAALVKSCRKRGVEFVKGAAAQVEHGAVILEAGGALEAETIVNAAGAWAGKIAARGVHIDVRPVKGQMAAVRAEGWQLRHSVRDDRVYLVPRNDARILVGATMEEAGYDKSVDPQVIRKLLEAGARLVPKIRNAPLVESWAGLRPATRNGLPLIGATKIPGYYLATGHLRDGILLAPITAKLLAEEIRTGKVPDLLRQYVP